MEFLKRVFSFEGRANRTEFWLVVVTVMAIVLVPAFLFFQPYSNGAKQYVNIAGLITLWPFIAVQVRRWHGRNKSGWWVLVNFIPLIGLIWIVIENGFLPNVKGKV